MKSLSRLPRPVLIGGAGTLLVVIILAGTFFGMMANGSHAASTSDVETLSVGLQTYHDAIFTDVCNFKDFQPQPGDGYTQDYNLNVKDGCYNFFAVDLRTSHQQLATYLNQNIVKVNGTDEVYAWEAKELQTVETKNADLVSQLGQSSPYNLTGSNKVTINPDNSNNPLSSAQQKSLDKAFTNVFVNSSPTNSNSGGYQNKQQDLATSLQTYHDDIYVAFCNEVVKKNTTVNNGQSDPCYTIVNDIRQNSNMTLSTYKDKGGNSLDATTVTNWEQTEFQKLETAHPELKNATTSSDPAKLDAAFTQVYIGSGQASNGQAPSTSSQSEDSLISAMQPDHDSLYTDICNYIKSKNINNGQSDPCYTAVNDINQNYTTLSSYIHGKDNSIAVSDIQTWEGNEYQVLVNNTQSHFYKVKDQYTQPDANTLDDILTKIYIGPSPSTSSSNNNPNNNNPNNNSLPNEVNLYNAMQKDHDAIYSDICNYAQSQGAANSTGDCWNIIGALNGNGDVISNYISSHSNGKVSMDDVKAWEQQELQVEFNASQTFKNTFSSLPTPDPVALDRAMSAVYVGDNSLYK